MKNAGVIHAVREYNSRLRIIDAVNGSLKNSFSTDIKHGLQSMPKFIPPKYFYDTIGSELFEKICATKEYYVTRTEASILKKYSPEIAELNSGKMVMVELGSGSSVKTKYLLNSFLALKGGFEYVPIDVSDIMVSSSNALIREFGGLRINGILSEYADGLSITSRFFNKNKIIVFLGSSIGNFSKQDSKEFMVHIASGMKDNDSLLIGFDLVKDINVLNAAYDDEEGVTAAFNLNLLGRINRELGGEFETEKFRHKAFFNSAESRIEMHLVSLEDQDVCIHSIGKSVHFDKGETIHTENSYKFTDEMIRTLAAHAGLEVTDIWKDDNNYFALSMMKKNNS
jgi:L-histidine Nalpha-methyltransferase